MGGARPLLVPVSTSAGEDFRSLASVEDGPLCADVEISSVFFLEECINSLWPSAGVNVSDVLTESGDEGALSIFLTSLSCSRELRDSSLFFLLENYTA